MDKNGMLIDLSENGRFWQVDIEELSPPERVFMSVWELEGEVNNGGFAQYFRNSSGDTAHAVEDALIQIGAHEMAKIAAQANGIFPGGIPPMDSDERAALLEQLTPEQEALLESLDDAFYEYPDDLTELLFDFVKTHAASIPGAAESGIK